MLDRLFGRKAPPPASTVQEQLAQAYALQQAGRLGEAKAGYEAFLAANPDHFDAVHMLGVLELQAGRAAEAAERLQHATRLAPQDPGSRNNLGEAWRRLGRLEEAAACYREAVERWPQYAAALYNLGMVLQRLGRREEAEQALRRALELEPEWAEAHGSLGAALAEAGRLDEALASAQRAVALRPELAAPRVVVGNVLREKGFLDEAAAAYRAAIECDPGVAEAYNNLGNVLKEQGKTEEALHAYEQALALAPDFAVARLNAAKLLREGGRLAEAAAAYRRLLEVAPDLAEAHFDLGNALKGVGDAEGALACYARALELDPDFAEARWAQAMSQLPLVAQDEAAMARSRAAFDAELAALEQWCEARGAEKTARAVGTQQPFYLAYHDEDHRARLARYGALCARLMGDWQRVSDLPALQRVTRADVRVGIVSAHVRDHSVWSAIVKGWLQHLDRQRFDVRLFHLGAAHDVETALAKTLVTHYTYGKSDLVEWTRLIIGHQLDVLIYPEVGMDPLTAKLASLRLAHVQAAAWGHPITTGLPTMDYFLSAEALEPAGADAHYTERLVRLPGLGCCTAPSASAAEVDLAALGIREGVPLLVSAGTPFKYTPRHDALFAEIARRLGGECQLVFFVPHPRELMERVRSRMARAFDAAGLDLAAHAAFVPWQSRPAFAGLLQQADVFLDTLGFSGFNTALQAIDAGLPVLAWEGRFLRARLASGILRRMELGELVAGTAEAYVDKAVRLARDAAYWGEVRGRMLAARAALHGDTAPVRALERFLAEAVSR
jgi:predicted O-linked N-acetylglucosamine transferase (SPINDLY family)